MYHFIKYLTHLITATNQHGVHSPFVYDYVTKCLYSKEKHSKKKAIDILLKSIVYFNVKTILLPSQEPDLQKIAVQKFPELQFGVSPCDMIFWNESNLENIDKLAIEEQKIWNNTMLMVDKIHKTRTAGQAWQKLKENEKVVVTIDLFYCGIVFFRKEQAKEHFKIRI